MAGTVQMPVTYTRLNNQPLDISLTFDTLLEARKYVAGSDNTKGTPYNGQIISVNKIGGSDNICGTFKVESSVSDINNYVNYNNSRLVLLEVKRLDTGTVITPANFITSIANGSTYLLVYEQINKTGLDYSLPALNTTETRDDLLLCNKPCIYSILALSELFTDNDGNIDVILEYEKSSGATTVNKSYKRIISGVNDNSTTSNDYLLSISGTNLLYGTIKLNNDNSGVILTRIRVEITDYLSRNGVK
jgi:hypothetical protein